MQIISAAFANPAIYQELIPLEEVNNNKTAYCGTGINYKKAVAPVSFGIETGF